MVGSRRKGEKLSFGPGAHIRLLYRKYIETPENDHLTQDITETSHLPDAVLQSATLGRPGQLGNPIDKCFFVFRCTGADDASHICADLCRFQTWL